MPTPLIGDRIKIIYNEGGTEPVSIEFGKTSPSPTASAKCGVFLKFRPGGEGYLSTLGYSRFNVEEDDRDTEDNSYGTDFWVGPWFKPKQEFVIQTQMVTPAEKQQLDAAVERSRWDKSDVYLLDQRIAMFEPLPRTRAAVGNIVTSPTPAIAVSEYGLVYYWAVFKVKLSLKIVKFDAQNGVYSIDITGREKYPVVTSDRAVW